MYFFKSTESENLSEAARRMFVSPQALNKQLQQLEEKVGEKLIDRRVGNGKSMELTIAGKRLKDCFQSSYEEFAYGCENFERYMDNRKKNLTIGYFQDINNNKMLMPILEKIKAKTKIDNVQLESGELGDVLQWIIDEKCDLGITNIHDSEKKREGIIYVPILEIPACIYVSPNHIWAQKDEITKADMEQETLLVIPWNEELEKDCFWRKAKVGERKEVKNTCAMMMEVKVGNYFAVTAEYVGEGDEKLVKKELPIEYQFNFIYCLIYKEGNIFEKVIRKISCTL